MLSISLLKYHCLKYHCSFQNIISQNIIAFNIIAPSEISLLPHFFALPISTVLERNRIQLRESILKLTVLFCQEQVEAPTFQYLLFRIYRKCCRFRNNHHAHWNNHSIDIALTPSFIISFLPLITTVRFPPPSLNFGFGSVSLNAYKRKERFAQTHEAMALEWPFCIRSSYSDYFI